MSLAALKMKQNQAHPQKNLKKVLQALQNNQKNQMTVALIHQMLLCWELFLE